MRALRISSDRTIKLPADVTRTDGFEPGDRVFPIREGRAVVLIPAPDFEATRGIAREGGDYYATYRERGGSGR